MKKFLVYGYGLEQEHAARLAKDGNKVFYYTNWQASFPKWNDYAIGTGLPGLNKVLYFWDYVDQVDCIVFLDVGTGDLVDHLRKKGYNVFGAGRGERLEYHRFETRKIQRRIGLPTQETTRIQGIPNLRKYLTKHKDVYVKLDIFRGDVDSFCSKDIKQSDLIIDDITAAVGPFKDNYKFVVEKGINGDGTVESGCDLIFNGDHFIKPYLIGYEIAKKGYIGKFTNELCPQHKNTIDKLTPILKKLDYRGFISTEERTVSKDTSYLIDLCCRLPFPLSMLYTEAIGNYSEVIYNVAKKLDVTVKNTATYVGALPIFTDYKEGKWRYLPLDFDLKEKDSYKIVGGCMIDGKYYLVKGDKIDDAYVVVVALGKSPEEVVKKLEKLVDGIKIPGLTSSNVGQLKEMRETIERGEKLGIKF